MDKQNIKYDFTDGKVFSKHSRNDQIFELIMVSVISPFPWQNMLDKVKSDKDLSGGEDPETTLFFTGTNKEIKYKQEYKEMTNGKMCECCGSKINRTPWSSNNYSMLCDRCLERIENNYGPDIFGIQRDSKGYEHPWWLV